MLPLFETPRWTAVPESNWLTMQLEWADAHGNTLLSEAAAGGALEVCKYLLELGANPNTQGEFQRSPLWRAAFLGKQDLVIPLLTAGADPRYIKHIYNNATCR